MEISDGTIEADMAESWEFSPDKLTLTMKIRADVGTPPNQAPLNGRKLDTLGRPVLLEPLGGDRYEPQRPGQRRESCGARAFD